MIDLIVMTNEAHARMHYNLGDYPDMDRTGKRWSQ
jgi:hypothetical protein